MIELSGIGGYEQVGKNMLAIKVKDEAVILDMGLDLESYIQYTQDEDVQDMSSTALMRIGAIPNISEISDWRKNVKAIVATHAHLDHIGAIPFLAKKFKAPVICTGFTAEVIKGIAEGQNKKIKNEIKKVAVNSTTKISENITIEFINVTHSTPQAVIIAIHTPEGTIIYATDFKFDTIPIIGKKTNTKRLKEIGETKKVLCLIVDSLRSNEPGKTPPEIVAKEMIKNVLLGTETKGNGIIITTFSSHLSRLKSIISFGQKLDRKVIFLGKSLSKYIKAGEEEGIIRFSDKIELCEYQSHIKKRLRKLKREREKYIIVCTGHQGEPKAILPRITNGEYDYQIEKDDLILFSCTVIPSSTNINNRDILEKKIEKTGARMYKDLHVSGHPCKEDLREIIQFVKPQKVIPCHGNIEQSAGLIKLTQEMGYELGKTVLLIKNGQRIELK